MARTNPNIISLLPKPMQRVVRFPKPLLIFWLLFLAPFTYQALRAPLFKRGESTLAKGNTPSGSVLLMAGVLQAGGESAYIRTENGKIQASTTAEFASIDWVGTPSEESLIIQRDGDSLRVKRDDEEFKIYSNGKLVWRIKMKPDEDKFSVYDGEGTQIHRGKFKKGSYRITNASEAIIGQIQVSAKPRAEIAAALTLPLGVAEKAIMVQWLSSRP